MITESKSGKMKIILSFIIATILLSVSVLAVISSYAAFQDGGSSMTISKTGTAVFNVSILSAEAPLGESSIYYSISMTNPSGTVVKSWANNVLDEDGWVELNGLTVNPADITVGGTYTINVSSHDNVHSSETTLSLIVVNSDTNITDITAPDSITAGEILRVSFNASDPDGDALTYRIYRNNSLISNTSNDAWQTAASDAGTYIYRFEVTDGESTVSRTKTIIVSPASSGGTPGDEGKETPETLKLNRDIEISQVYTDFLKIRSNKGEKIRNFELRVTYMDLNSAEKYSFDLGRDEIAYKMITANLEENKDYLAKIEIKAGSMEDSGYLVLRG